MQSRFYFLRRTVIAEIKSQKVILVRVIIIYDMTKYFQLQSRFWAYKISVVLAVIL